MQKKKKISTPEKNKKVFYKIILMTLFSDCDSIIQASAGVFGVSLSDPPLPQIPGVIDSAMNHIIEKGIEIEGIFRISPSLSKLEDIVIEIDAGMSIHNLLPSTV